MLFLREPLVPANASTFQERRKNSLPLPNFFVIGAPKSGTTALYDCLKQHPEIYMSPVKEPHFFALNGQPPAWAGPAGSYRIQTAVWRPRDYFMLFAGATNQCAVGEASLSYLRSPLAAQRIKHYLPESKQVVILRQPADRAYSDYVFRIQRGWETAGSFTEALELEDSRRAKGWPDMFFYALNGCYHTQLSAYYKRFRREVIISLQDIIGRDLSHWLKAPTPSTQHVASNQ